MNSDAKEPGAQSAEQAIIEGRKAKATASRANGKNPFANNVKPKNVNARSLDIAAVRALVEHTRTDAKYAEETVKKVAEGAIFHVHGRVIALRSTGGLTFIRLRDRTGEIQLLISEAVMGAEYTNLEALDIGDIIDAEGLLTASKRGELSIETTRLGLVTKAYRPLPEKWHGLTDVETRYRQRYVDLIANPEVSDVFRARSLMVKGLRTILDGDGFLEVETPLLHSIIGGAVARPFHTHHNTLDMDLFLRIAPELYLKRLVVGGFERVYEIGRCFRNEGISTRHNPEFTMLEFYRAYATYEDLMDFIEVLLRGVDSMVQQAMPHAHTKWVASRSFTLEEPFVRLPMADGVARAAKATQIPDWIACVDKGSGPGLVALLKDHFLDNIKEWSKASPRAKAIDWGNFRKGFEKCDNDGERLFCCYEYLVEPLLVQDYRSADGTKSLPVFVKDYPFETSPLARRNDARPDLVDRFEIFVDGRELGNGFSELNDPEDQAARFREQVDKKARGVEETMDYDADYIRALEHGMPPAAGFGMGVERLVMLLTSTPSIRDVILFPLLRPS